MGSESLINEICSVLQYQGAEKVILFGSYAYGNPKPESDIDLLVIKNIPESEIRNFRIKLKKALWQNFNNLNISFDIVVDNEQRIKERINMGDLFYNDIYSNGKVIYA